MLSVLSLKKSNRLLNRQQETSVVWVDIQLSVFPTVRHFAFFICNDVCNKLFLILIFLTTARGVDKHHTALTEPPVVVVLLLRLRDRHHILHRIAAVPRSETAGCPPVRTSVPVPVFFDQFSNEASSCGLSHTKQARLPCPLSSQKEHATRKPGKETYRRLT